MMHARMIRTRVQGIAFALLLLIAMFGAPIHSEASVSDSINATIECEKNPDVACPETTPSAAEMETQSAAVSFNAGEYIKMLVTFAIVIGLLFLVLKFVKKHNKQVQQNALMQNLGGVAVGQQKSIQLVKVGNKILMVGVGENVQLLREIDDEAEIEQLLATYESQQVVGETTPYFLKIFQKRTTPTSSQENFSDVLNKRLTEIKQDRSKELAQWHKEEEDKHE